MNTMYSSIPINVYHYKIYREDKNQTFRKLVALFSRRTMGSKNIQMKMKLLEYKIGLRHKSLYLSRRLSVIYGQFLKTTYH